jgi:hypothetical protein
MIVGGMESGCASTKHTHSSESQIIGVEKDVVFVCCCAGRD